MQKKLIMNDDIILNSALLSQLIMHSSLSFYNPPSNKYLSHKYFHSICLI